MTPDPDADLMPGSDPGCLAVLAGSALAIGLALIVWLFR